MLRRPNASAGLLMAMNPMIVPIRALDNVKPSMNNSVSANWFYSQSVVPEITAVSKPNSSSPSAATSVHPKR